MRYTARAARWSWRSTVSSLFGTGLMLLLVGAPVTAADVDPELTHLVDSSALIGLAVVNPQGAELGEIDGLAIDYANSTVAYAVLSYGGYFDGWLDIESKRFAVPAAALKLVADRQHFIVAIDEDQIQAIQGFDQYDWPDMKDRAWADELHELYNLVPKWKQLRPDDSNMTDLEQENARYLQFQSIGILQTADDLIGMEIRDAEEGEPIGELQTLRIDWNAGQAVRAVLALDTAAAGAAPRVLSLAELTLKAKDASTEIRFSPDHYFVLEPAERRE